MILRAAWKICFLCLLALSASCGPSPRQSIAVVAEAGHTVMELAAQDALPALATEIAAVVNAVPPAVLIGTGDISVCGMHDDAKTADLIKRLLVKYPQAQVFTAGDNVQINGHMYEFVNCFDQTWGAFRDKIRPSPGNHDWHAEQGEAYFAYFGPAAGPPGLGYYSYALGDWHIVSLNSNCDIVSCDENSEQAAWLRADLQQNTSLCTLMYWHHPLWSSGNVPISTAGAAFWQIGSEYGVDVVVNGHDHHYERLAPLDANGKVDMARGIRPFVVGTGGAWLFDFGEPLPASEVRNDETLGVIVFILYPDRYEWSFVPADGGTFRDSGSHYCH